MVRYFVTRLTIAACCSFIKAHLRDDERDGTLCACRLHVHTYLPNQNVLFIHILLWKLMLKYFIAEHCEIVGKKYLANFFPTSLPSFFPFYFFPFLASNMFAFGGKIFCLLSIKHLKASQILRLFYSKGRNSFQTKSDFVYMLKNV